MGSNDNDMSDFERQMMTDLSALLGSAGPFTRVKEMFAVVANAICDEAEAAVNVGRAHVTQVVSDQPDTAAAVKTAKSNYADAQATVRERVTELPDQLREVVKDNVDLPAVRGSMDEYRDTVKLAQAELVSKLAGAVSPQATMEALGLFARLQAEHGDKLASVTEFFTRRGEEPSEDED